MALTMIWIVLMCCTLRIAECNDNSVGDSELSNTGPATTTTTTSKQDVFKKLFILHRIEQLNAVKKIRAMQEDKQIRMVKTVTKTVFNVIEKSKAVLEESGYIPGISEFPEKEKVRDALSLVLENTALMGDLVLRMPDVTEPLLRSTPEWPILIAWGVNFANQSKLIDNSTATLIDLVGQELNITTRHPRYVNPYRKKDEVKPIKSEELDKKKKKKRAPLPRGPRLTSSQMGEL